MKLTTLAIVFTLGVSLVAGQLGRGLNSQTLQFMRQMTALKYNDVCSWQAEEARQNFTKLASNQRLMSLEQMIATQRFQSDVIAQNKKFCSASEQFICDKETQRCVCGDPGKKVLFPEFNVSSEYVVEDNQCNWKEGSYCISDDIFQSAGVGSMVHLSCARGTSCNSKLSGGGPCSFNTLVNYILRTYSYRAGRSQVAIIRDMFNGKICTCVPDRTINAIDVEAGSASWENNEVAGRYVYRSKRSLGASAAGMSEEEFVKSVISPVLAQL